MIIEREKLIPNISQQCMMVYDPITLVGLLRDFCVLRPRFDGKLAVSKIENKENKIENKIETQKAHSRALLHLFHLYRSIELIEREKLIPNISQQCMMVYDPITLVGLLRDFCVLRPRFDGKLAVSKIENKENKIENKIETQKAHSRAIWHLVMPCWAVLGRAGPCPPRPLLHLYRA